VSALIFLVKTFSDLYLLCFLLRILLQAVRADFYNPISQFIVRVTNPLVKPARRMVPSAGGIDLPTMVVLVVLQLLVTAIMLALIGVSAGIGQLIWLVLFRLIALLLWAYTICIFVYVILSWLAQASYSPIAMLLGHVVEPVLRPARRLLPPLGGLDLSPLIVLVLIQAALIALVTSIAPILIAPALTPLIR
jgi:YggT family protein